MTSIVHGAESPRQTAIYMTVEIQCKPRQALRRCGLPATRKPFLAICLCNVQQMTPHAQTRGLVMDIPCCIDAVAERPAISHVHKEQVQPYDMDAATDPNCILASICDSNSSFSHFSSSFPPKKLALFIMLPLLVSHRLVHRHVGGKGKNLSVTA